ncbi:TIGR03759 family integrating conjugative element protein [Scandinavium sp. M-37]|uniref:TIGR03759 family integrating conjugative element protein n=1 Tax=Scandinavium sp. M-37 TaxID=3373077 RepID=UPI0037467804
MKTCSFYSLLLLLGISLPASSADTRSVATTRSTDAPLGNASTASLWGLSSTEWSRYQQLKLGERGIWSPSLDPLTTLGVEASSDAERRKYADMLVEKEYQRVEKELAFQRAYDAAWQRRFPQLTPVSAAVTLSDIPTHQRLAVFVRENCTACDARVETLLKTGNPLDIYIVDSRNDDTRLRRWALIHRIDRARVGRREITLNHDGGRWLQYGQGRMPAVLEKQGDTWLSVFR